MYKPKPAPPGSIDELMSRADEIAGLTLGDLALIYGIDVPENLKREKGWTGQLLEWALGASAGSKPEQDFLQLGVELKTLPVSYSGQPLETTFVCVAPLTGITGDQWQTCHLRTKLSTVLWVPVLAERDIPPGERQIGTPFLWTLQGEQEHALRQDWEELMELIALGKLSEISGKQGQYLQLRPKAANSKALTEAFDSSGLAVKALPRGFYLKKAFTASILADHFQ